MSEASIKYLSNKVDTIKESSKKSYDRLDNRITRLRKRLAQHELLVKQLHDFLLLSPHGVAYEVFLGSIKDAIIPKI